jgi:hypothetical protein
MTREEIHDLIWAQVQKILWFAFGLWYDRWRAKNLKNFKGQKPNANSNPKPKFQIWHLVFDIELTFELYHLDLCRLLIHLTSTTR